jgi:glycosyltransferase involved in cell wall biosynthesis
MRILKITGGYPPAEKQGGTAVVGHALCRALSNLGQQVKVLTTNINGDGFLPWENQWRKLDGIDVFYAKANKKVFPYYSPTMIDEFLKLLPDTDVVLIASVWTWYGPQIGKICCKSKIPYVIYPHGCRARARMKIQGWLKKTIWWHVFDRRFYNNADMIVAITKEEKEELRSIGVKAPIKVIPNGIEKSPKVNNSREHLNSRYNIKKESDIILFLGRIEPIKGVDIAIKAMREVAEQFPNSILVVAGPEKDGLQAKMEQLSDQLGLSEKIIFTGSVKGDDKWALLQEAAVLVLPSVTEVLAMSVLEALECSVPVVLTQKYTWPEIIKANAGIITERTPRAVADALKRILSDSDLKIDMGRRGKMLVEQKFRWPKVAQRTIDMCESLLYK